MKSGKRRIYFSLFTLIVLLIVAYFTALQSGWFEDSNVSVSTELDDFAIKDTSSIVKFTITKSTGETATLTKETDGTWKVNNKFRVRPESISLLMHTFHGVRVKTRVGAAARNNIIKNIAVHHRKVEIFSKDGLIKTWYVGNPTTDRQGTYMLLEDPEKGRSSEPFVMELLSFHGQLDTRFFTGEEDWRYTGLFTIEPTELKSVKLISNEKKDDGFTINVTAGNKLELLDHQGGKVPGFDSITVRAYTFNFKKIHFEHMARTIDFKKLDSLKATTPFAVLEVSSIKSGKQKCTLYRMPNKSDQPDLDGNLLPYNPERAYALLDNGDLVVVQYHTFNKLLRPISSFFRAK